MEGLNFFKMMKDVADRGLRNQKKGPKDYFDDDGLLVCGVCGEHRQMMLECDDPTPEEPNRKTQLLAPCSCQCEQKAEEAQKKAEAEEKERKEWERRNALTVASLVDLDIKGEKFGPVSFSDCTENKFNEKNLRDCRMYVEKFDTMFKKNQGLLMWGDVGTGKSMAAACIANALLRQKYAVVMTSFVKLLEIFQKGKDVETDILNKLNRTQLLILDDLGAERDTATAMEKVYNIVDSRYRRRAPMILTTNLGMDQMKNESDPRFARIYDRVFEVCFPMQFAGKSFRRIEANQRYVEMQRMFEK